jgi:hypothetical protein
MLGGERVGRGPREQQLASMTQQFGLVVPLPRAAHPFQGIGQGLFRLGDLTLVLLRLCQKSEEMGDKKRCSGGAEGGDTFPDAGDTLRCLPLIGQRPALEYHGIGGPECESVFRREGTQFIGVLLYRSPVARELRKEASVREG